MSKREPRMAGTVKTGRHKFPIRKEELPNIRQFIETTPIDKISEEMRKVVEREWTDLVHKLPPRMTRK